MKQINVGNLSHFVTIQIDKKFDCFKVWFPANLLLISKILS